MDDIAKLLQAQQGGNPAPPGGGQFENPFQAAAGGAEAGAGLSGMNEMAPGAVGGQQYIDQLMMDQAFQQQLMNESVMGGPPNNFADTLNQAPPSHMPMAPGRVDVGQAGKLK